MLTFHPKAKRLPTGSYAAMVMQRNSNGQMHGSAVSKFGFSTECEAFAHAVACARRVADRTPFARVAV